MKRGDVFFETIPGDVDVGVVAALAMWKSVAGGLCDTIVGVCGAADESGQGIGDTCLGDMGGGVEVMTAGLRVAVGSLDETESGVVESITEQGGTDDWLGETRVGVCAGMAG